MKISYSYVDKMLIPTMAFTYWLKYVEKPYKIRKVKIGLTYLNLQDKVS